VPELGPLGSVRGALSNGRPYRDPGTSYLNLIAQLADRQWSWWGRVIFHVADVDGLYARARAAGFSPAMAPRDAEWGERYFHLTDPDGHELSFARPLPPQA
jgi:catechol 2,3-dioxygenase-like lactoylglutathione lyase family enzyme